MASCGKVRYSSRKAAKAGLKRVKKETDIPVKTVYYCEDCSCFHHTSQSKGLNRFITNNIKNKSNGRK